MKISKPKIIVRPKDFTPTRQDMEIVGTFNMGASTIVKDGIEQIVGMVRVAESPIEEPRGKVLVPYAKVSPRGNPTYEIDFFQIDKRKEIIPGTLGKKELKVKKITLPWNNETIENVWLHRHISHPKLGFSRDGINFDWSENFSYFPSWPHEAFGIEDNRIIKLNGNYIFTSTSPDVDQSVGTSFVKTEDFKKIVRLPLPANNERQKYTPRFIFVSEKNAIPLPKRVNHPYMKDPLGEPAQCWASLTRDNAYQENSPARINVEFSFDLLHWGGPPHTLMRASNTKDTLGGGTNLEEGVVNGTNVFWGFYHYVSRGVYRAGLFAIDSKNPWNLVARTEPFLKPNQHEYRKKGYLPNVFYPTGLVIINDTAFLYGGQQDNWTSVQEFKKSTAIAFLETA